MLHSPARCPRAARMISAARVTGTACPTPSCGMRSLDDFIPGCSRITRPAPLS